MFLTHNQEVGLLREAEMLRLEKRELRGFKSLRDFKHSMSWKGPFCRSREFHLGSVYKTTVCCVSVCVCACVVHMCV